MKLLGPEVVQQHVEGQHVLDGVDRGVLGEQIRHGGVVDGADGDGLAAVDLRSQVGGGEVVVEGGEVGEFLQDFCDVVG